MVQVNSLRRALALEQMAVMRSLLHRNGMDSVSLLEDLFRRGPVRDEARQPRLRPRLLAGLVDSVQSVGDGEGAYGDVEAALYSCNQQTLATGRKTAPTCLLAMGVIGWRTYAEAFVHRLGMVGSVGVVSSRLLIPQQIPGRSR